MMARWGRPTVVLGYHDLIRPRERGSWLKLNVEHFERQIVLLKRIGRFIRPVDLMKPECLARGRLNLLLTFDDGLVNNYRLGLPVLQRHGVPALYFISTWNMENEEPFWFDLLIRSVQRGRLSELDLSALGLNRYRFNPMEDKASWSAIQRLLEDVKRLDARQDGRLVERVLIEMERKDPCARDIHEDDRPLNQEEIHTMRDSSLCWFGSHSHRHRILTKLDDGTLMKELRRSRITLETLLGETVESIAYPNGDADARVREACRRAGYRFGYTVTPGRVGPATDFFQIPRILVGGFDSPWRVILNLARGLMRPGPETV